jgi:hypothetical protein
MKPKKINANQLKSLFDKLAKENEKSTGYYEYKNFKIKIVKPMTGSERYSKLYNYRRKNGLCIACGKKVKKHNKQTGKLYRLCETHRKKIDGTRSKSKKKKK